MKAFNYLVIMPLRCALALLPIWLFVWLGTADNGPFAWGEFAGGCLATVVVLYGTALLTVALKRSKSSGS